MASEIKTAEKLLITGITGYIGFQTLVLALQQGFDVRGIVRSASSIDDLAKKSSVISDGHVRKQLEFIVIPDFLQPGALDGVLDGVSAVVHLASPMAYGIEGNDFEETVVKPAVLMNTLVLEAAAKSPSVRRVVVTSSCVTLVPFEWNMAPNSERLYTASDINSNPQPPYQSVMEAYWASKAKARMEVRRFIEAEKPAFDFVQLLPSVVIGRDDRCAPGDDRASLVQGTRQAVLAPVLDSSLNSSFPYVGVPVHVADVARAHIDAVDSRIPGNSEFILSSDTPEGVVWDEDIPAIAKKYFPANIADGTLPMKGSLGYVKFRVDGMSTEKAFGWKFTSFEDTMKGLIEQYLEMRS
ncbi:hypothetical protein B0I35DRAFT_480218 [Stachybotrys elegans]|uniref:NAD-dependent epimerase/dehydratase domain-containing protein n=1 Tax=Stachybotrys elegans TaxID=80388 RepID=A0A8K0SNN9_9HYPO|nr:hypothetical protein B0I35DRAFT_480218 [Stachybotrys elegans]